MDIDVVRNNIKQLHEKLPTVKEAAKGLVKLGEALNRESGNSSHKGGDKITVTDKMHKGVFSDKR
jgi:hypothetical protein